MSDITSELNLLMAVDDDDTADYLTQSLAQSLNVIDGLFSQTTGHTHNGAHQGGLIDFMNVTVGQSLTVNGPSTMNGPLNVTGATTLNTLHVTGTTQLDGAINGGSLAMSGSLTVGVDLQVNRNAGIAGSLTVTGPFSAGAVTSNGGISAATSIYAGTTIQAGGRGIFAGYDAGGAWGMNVGGNGICSGRWFQRANGSAYCYDNLDFTFSPSPSASTLVQRDGSGYINASYINYTGDLQPGKPAQILGRTAGDNYMRWWPASAVGPPALTQPGTTFNGGTGTSGNWTERCTITVPRTGYYVAMAWLSAGGGTGSNWGGNVRWRYNAAIGAQGFFQFPSNAACQFGFDSLVDGGTQLLSAGQSIGFQVNCVNNVGCTIQMQIVFVPTDAYPG